MRISTANAYNNAIDTLMQRQNELMGLQAQMTSGKRVAKASDDPAAAARAERALAAQSQTTFSQRAVDASKTAMSLTESTLGQAGELLQQVREALVAAGNASYSDADRLSLADTVSGLRTQLLGLANSTDANGAYLFGGQGANEAPFAVDPSTQVVSYIGTAGQNAAASPDTLPLTFDGAAVWSMQPGASVFDRLDQAIAALRTPGRSGAQIAADNAAALANLDAIAAPLQSARSVAGNVLNRIDNVADRLSAQLLAAQTEESNATDVDMTQALSAFASQQTGYDAALKSYAMVQRLSLFQYLSG